MSEAMKSVNAALNVPSPAKSEFGFRALSGYLPAILPLIGAALMVTARIKLGAAAVPADGSLVVLAVLCYIIASASLMTNFYAPIGFLQKLGLWISSLGFFFNLSGWLVRWVSAGDRENWIRMTNQITGEYHFWWFFSYIPFANLYDLSVAFAFGAAFASLLISHRENTRFIGAISMPLVALILLLAIFIGNAFINLPPVLDSYWRPIHVGVASMSYGVALVSFALAVMYLLKDGMKIETMAIYVASFIFVGFAAFSQSYDRLGIFHDRASFFSIQYRLNAVIPHSQGVSNSGARVVIPWVGPLLTITLLLMIVTAICYIVYTYKQNEAARKWGTISLRASLVPQLAAIVALFTYVKSSGSVGSFISSDQFYWVGKTLLGKDATGMAAAQITTIGSQWIEANRSALVLNAQANPVEIASMLSAFVLTGFLVLFGFRTEKVRAGLPALEKLDSLTYKTVGVAFAGLAILLVTGAIWANESWGRYWGWDAKETGALVAWLSYAGYLHTRIAHGWTGRRSAYFAVVGFLLVLFTYLGVSYLLPGLHSYA
ncbi:MAG: cytochrome c biogenesis protein CcsA [Acidobacteria bacterium]|nr:cytochrome c biogenesis protein CcsA [Acidobacteriota bacterium]